MIAAILLFGVIAFFVVRQMLRNRGKEDWELEEEREERKEKRKQIIEEKKAALRDKKEGKKKEPKKEKKQKKTAKTEDDGDDETGVLSGDGDGETGLLRGARLVNAVTGKRIEISRDEYTIGKASSGVDYRIQDNNTVSRKHCQIVKKKDGYYVEDLNSKNGTYIDGDRLQPFEPMLIQDGQTLLLSDEKYIFEEK